MRYHHFGEGRYVVRLDPGEELVASLKTLVEDEDLTAGSITGIGSVSAVTLGFLDPEAGEYVRRRWEEPLEVAQLTGTVSKEGARPHVHLHAVVAPRELLAYAGHVHEATVGAVMEIFLTSLPVELRRLPVAGQPFPGLFLPGEPAPEDDAAAK